MATAKKKSIEEQLQERTPAKKRGGIGNVWTNTTHSISEIAVGVGSLATAGRLLAANAVEQAAQGRIESAQEMCKTMGIDADGIEALTTSKALTDYIVSQ